MSELDKLIESQHKRLEDVGSGRGETTTMLGLALTDSEAGEVYVTLPGAVVPQLGLSGKPGEQQVLLPTAVHCKAGDTVVVSLVGNEVIKSPYVMGALGGEDALNQRIVALENATSDEVLTISRRAHYGEADRTAAAYPCCYSVGDEAFALCSNMTAAVFPSCYYIGDDVFSGCTSLHVAIFPWLQHMGEYAFNRAQLDTLALFYSLEEVPRQGFANTSMGSIIAPKLRSIGERGFYNARISADFPLVTSIGDYAFRGSSTSVANFPLATFVGQYAFQSTEIHDTNFPLLETVGRQAFSECVRANTPSRSLVSMHLPHARTFGAYAFAMSSYFEELNLYSPDRTELPTYGDLMFRNTQISPQSGRILINSELVSALQNASGWSIYANVIQAYTPPQV